MTPEFLPEEEAFRVTEECLELVEEEKKANAATVIDEVGMGKFKERLVLG